MQTLLCKLELSAYRKVRNTVLPEKPDIYYTLPRRQRRFIHEIERSGGTVTEFDLEGYWISCGLSGYLAVSSEDAIPLIEKGILILRQTNSPDWITLELGTMCSTWTKRYWLSWLEWK